MNHDTWCWVKALKSLEVTGGNAEFSGSILDDYGANMTPWFGSPEGLGERRIGDAVFVEFVAEGPDADAEDFGCACPVSVEGR
jgi:hypothetical protein